MYGRACACALGRGLPLGLGSLDVKRPARRGRGRSRVPRSGGALERPSALLAPPPMHSLALRSRCPPAEPSKGRAREAWIAGRRDPPPRGRSPAFEAAQRLLEPLHPPLQPADPSAAAAADRGSFGRGALGGVEEYVPAGRGRRSAWTRAADERPQVARHTLR